jgi:hypothetical protein
MRIQQENHSIDQAFTHPGPVSEVGMARHRRALVLYKRSISPSPGPGDVIPTEALPYRGAVSICGGANFKLKGLPMDELGVLPEALEAELTEKPKTSEDILNSSEPKLPTAREPHTCRM